MTLPNQRLQSGGTSREATPSFCLCSLLQCWFLSRFFSCPRTQQLLSTQAVRNPVLMHIPRVSGHLEALGWAGSLLHAGAPGDMASSSHSMDYSSTLTSDHPRLERALGANQPPASGIKAVLLLQAQLTHAPDLGLRRAIASRAAVRAPCPTVSGGLRRGPPLSSAPGHRCSIPLHLPPAPAPRMETATELLVRVGAQDRQTSSPGHGCSQQTARELLAPFSPAAPGLSSCSWV